MKLTRAQVLQLQAEMVKFENINCGGCAVWASIVAKELIKRGHDAKIVTTSDQYKVQRFRFTAESINVRRAEMSSNTMKDWERAGVDFGHVLVEVTVDDERVYIDSERIVPMGETIRCGFWEMTPYPGYVDLADAIKVARNKAGWNPRYSRKQTPAMRATIKQVFKELAVA